MLDLYKAHFNIPLHSVQPLSSAGSNRKYFRLADVSGEKVIGVEGVDRKENHAFIALANQMGSKNLTVPKILAVSDDGMKYLQTDLGATSLYDIIESERKKGDAWSSRVVDILFRVVKDLPRIQFLTADGFDFTNCCREQEFSEKTVLWDLNYFKYCFLKLSRITFDEILLEEEFCRLKEALLSAYQKMSAVPTFLYRDFQSRNIMVCACDVPYYIDFQGGFRGPVYYDLASFLWQARAQIPQQLREDLILAYFEVLRGSYYNIEWDEFRPALNHYALFRLLQALGAYGYRGLFERKTMFVSPIILALREALGLCDDYPYIKSLLEAISVLPQFQPSSAKGQLTVRVSSFSFKKGIPEDYSGNGGGFVFDCRALMNPGRFPEYIHLTGLDQPVQDFLREKSLMPAFLENVFALIAPAVETYLARGFSSLMVSFGCTGGQHRSVYGAQQLARHIFEKYPAARVVVNHRELGLSFTSDDFAAVKEEK